MTFEEYKKELFEKRPDVKFHYVMDKAIDTCDLNLNPDDRVHSIVANYSVQWNKASGYFEIRKSGKIVGYAPTFEEARKQVLRMYNAE